MTRVFSREDDEFLRENWPFSMSLEELASHFGVSTSTIKRQTTRLKLPPCPIELRQSRVGDKLRVWDQSTIVAEIQRLGATGPLNSQYVQQNHGSLHTSACGVFGSWKAAIAAAGLDYDDISLYSHRTTWTADSIRARICEMERAGDNLRASTVIREHSDVFNAARRDPTLGSWRAAIESAGLDYDEICGARWGDRYAAADGQEYDSRLEGLVAERLFELKGRGLIRGYASKVRVCIGRRWNCDFVVSLVCGPDLWLEVDGLGEARDDGAYDRGNPKIAYYDEVGLQYAVVRTAAQAEAAILDGRKRGLLTSSAESPRVLPVGRNQYTDEEILDELRRVASLLGHTPTNKEFKRLGRIDPSTASLRFGRWTAALEEAGLATRRHRG